MQNWNDFFELEKNKQYFIDLMNFVNNEYQTKTIYPKYEEIFNAFKYTKLEDVKIVILGQDPYQTPGYSNGLCFSVNENIKLPKSLQNIYKELESDLNIVRENGDLTSWAKNGVLLLNTILTVEKDKSLSHKDKGWEILIDNVIKLLNLVDRKIVFILWGSLAISKKALLNNPNHLIITSVHPSPLSSYRGFFGSKPFSKACDFLNINYDIWK